MKSTTTLLVALMGCVVMAGCQQSTPSMMNTSRVELSTQTGIDQVPVSKINDGYLSALASQYGRYGEGPIDLTVSYDPSSKSYTAMKAVNQLSFLSEALAKKGLNNIRTATLPVDGQAEPTLMVSYDMVTAQGPADCGNMEGLYSNTTSRDVGDYRFGCGVEQMLARQVSRPADLRGRGTVDQADGRRASNVSEAYRAITVEDVNTELDSFDRDDIQQ
jgi:type IV pilus biogenesis protein CpaD/CtpE